MSRMGCIVGRQSLPVLVVSASAWLLCSTAANAEDAQIKKLETEIQRMEARHQAEIKALRAEIRQLQRQKTGASAVTQDSDKRGLAQAPAEQRVSPTAPGRSASQGPAGVPSPALPPQVLMIYDRGYHFGLSDATKANTIELFGRLQIDTAGYLDYKPGPATLDQKGLADGIDLRRARIGVIGNFMNDWHYAFVYDFGNTSDSLNPNNAFANANSGTSPTTSNNFLSGVENALITYNGFYSHGQRFPVAIDFGIWNIPWTTKDATSSNDIMFIERSSSQVVATEFGGGDFRSALDVRSNNDRYWVGAFLTGPTSGALHTAGASCNTGTAPPIAGTPCVTNAAMTGLSPQLSFLTRGSYQLIQTPDVTLHVGANYANLFQPRVGANLQAIQLFDRPELRVDPTTFLNTGIIPATGGSGDRTTVVPRSTGSPDVRS